VASTAPDVNHLIFADDILLFFSASTEGADDVKKVLEQYCNASGQRINMDKSSVFFSKGYPEAVRNGIKKCLMCIRRL
jgi:hypothetical protein